MYSLLLRVLLPSNATAGSTSKSASGTLTSAMCSVPSTRERYVCATNRPCFVGIFAGGPQRSTSICLRRAYATKSAVEETGIPKRFAKFCIAARSVDGSDAWSPTGGKPASFASSTEASVAPARRRMPPSLQHPKETAPGHTSAETLVSISSAASRPLKVVPGAKSSAPASSAPLVASPWLKSVCMSASIAAAMCVAFRGERPSPRAATESAGCARLLLSSTILCSDR